LLITALCLAEAKQVTLSNKDPRLDTNGNVVDCHDGPIVGPINGTYFLYGEWYGENNFAVQGSNALPKLSVYTSADLTSGSWEYRGLLHNNTNPGWNVSKEWPWAPAGAWYSPSAVFSEARQKFIMYFSASQAECCEAQWGVAQSDDGVHFELVSMTATSSMKSSLDGSSLFIDDDGVGYVAYDAMQAPGLLDHVVSIDRLSPDLLSSSGERMVLFNDSFVEGTMLFKRKGRYYVIYSSCCCACREGAGAVVLSATNITGPWTRQSRDVNCKADVPVCAGMPSPAASGPRPTGKLTIDAQGIAISVLRGAGADTTRIHCTLLYTKHVCTTLVHTRALHSYTHTLIHSYTLGEGGEDVYLWEGMRWLSGPHNPPKCTSLCQAPTGVCAQDATTGAKDYRTAADFDYWVPLAFDADGSVLQFDDFVEEFHLTVAP
jgi:hypothetical protein